MRCTRDSGLAGAASCGAAVSASIFATALCRLPLRRPASAFLLGKDEDFTAFRLSEKHLCAIQVRRVPVYPEVCLHVRLDASGSLQPPLMHR